MTRGGEGYFPPCEVAPATSLSAFWHCVPPLRDRILSDFLKGVNAWMVPRMNGGGETLGGEQEEDKDGVWQT